MIKSSSEKSKQSEFALNDSGANIWLNEELRANFRESVMSLAYSIRHVIRSNNGTSRIEKVANNLGVSVQYILNVLTDAGYVINNPTNYALKFEQIEVVALAYEKSVERLFNKAKRDYYHLTPQEISDYADFFRNFIIGADECTDEKILLSEVNRYLIHLWVYNQSLIGIEGFISQLDKSIVDEYYLLRRRYKSLYIEWLGVVSPSYKMCYKLKHKQKLTFKRYIDFRNIIGYIVLNNHFHVFPNEDENMEKASGNLSFSMFPRDWDRKAFLKSFFIKAPLYEVKYT